MTSSNPTSSLPAACAPVHPAALGAKVRERGRLPKYLAVHEWESEASSEREEFSYAMSTP